MSSANEKAEIILIVIKKALRWIVTILLLMIGTVTIYIQYSDWNYEKHKKATQELDDKVVVKAVYPDHNECPADYPYLYLVMNNTNKTVKSVFFKVDAQKKGFSRTLNDLKQIEEYKILKPDEGWAGCFKLISNTDFKTPITEKDIVINISDKKIEFME